MKQHLKQILCIVIIVFMALGTVTSNALAVEDNVITGTFNCMLSFEGNPSTETYYYSDDYFMLPSTQQNQHLTTMSMALSLASMEIDGSSYITKLLGDIGCEDIQIYDMDITPTKDTVGTAIAHKKIGDSDLIVISIRGNHYRAEWVSNLTAGLEGNIEGLNSASEKVISRLKEYIAEYNLKNIKLWCTGYSRAGGVSDIVGVYVNEHLDDFCLTAENLYVYTFGAPRCCASSKIYDNIYCIKNKNDIVTYVYPKSWGLYTNGVDIFIGENKTVKKTKIDILGETLMVPIGEKAMDEFDEEFTEFITGDLNREIFSGEFDDSLAALAELYFSKPSNEWKPTFDYLKKDFVKKVKSNNRFLYVMLAEIKAGIMLHNSDKMYRQLTDELLLVLDETTSAEELHLTDDEYQIVRDNLYPILRALGPVFVKDYYYKENIDYSTVLPSDYDDPDYDPQNSERKVLTYNQCFSSVATKSGNAGEDITGINKELCNKSCDNSTNDFKNLTLYHFGTFFANIKNIIREHYPQVNWIMVTSLDPNYTREASVNTPDTPDPDKKNTPLYGDVDSDRKITAKDSMLIQRYVISLAAFDDTQSRAADVNGDGKITNKDALDILRYTIFMSKNKNIGKHIT